MKYRGFYIEISPHYRDYEGINCVETLLIGYRIDIYENEHKLKLCYSIEGIIGDNMPKFPLNCDSYPQDNITDLIKDYIDSQYGDYKREVKKYDD